MDINSDEVNHDKELKELMNQINSSPDVITNTYTVYVDGRPMTNWRLMGHMEGLEEVQTQAYAHQVR